MPPTLASLVQHSALKLTVRAGEDRLDDAVRWVHASELADPVPVHGGRRAAAHHRARRWTPRTPRRCGATCGGWRAPGSSGSASPSASTTTEIPRRWSRRRGRRGCRCWRCPGRTPFLAISKAVSAAIAADQYRAVTAGLRGPAGTDPRRALPTAPRPARPARRARGRLGRAVRRVGRGRRGRARLGRAARRPARPATWSGCGSAPRPPAPWSARMRDDRVETPVAGHGPPDARRSRRGHGRGARHGRAVRRALGGRPADPHHGTVPGPAGRRAAAGRRGAADAARRAAGPCAGGGRATCTGGCSTRPSGC